MKWCSFSSVIFYCANHRFLLSLSVPFLFSSGGPLGYTKGLATLSETFARKERLFGDFRDGRSFDSEDYADYTSCNSVRALATDRFCLSGKSLSPLFDI